MNKALSVKQPNLQDMVTAETENRAILTEFITHHMKDGTDFGSISFGGKMSKPCLFKSGAEKFASLMKLRADVVKDADTWEMAGSKPGLFCYRCRLFNQKNEEVGMGLGACSIEEKKNANNAIKIAKKRAFVDAILTTGALSDFFTQDLEDMETSHQNYPVKTNPSVSQTQQNKGYVVQPTKQEKLPPTPITDDDKVHIRELQGKKGITREKMEEAIEFLTSGKSSVIADLTHDEAMKIISKLQSLPDKKGASKPTVTEPEINIDEVDAGIEQTRMVN